MKAVTLWQPWASLVMIGAKPFEFRSWDYSKRFPSILDTTIVIHAGARKVRYDEALELMDRCHRNDDTTGLDNPKAGEYLRGLVARMDRKEPPCELGAGLGTVRIGKPLLADEIYGGDISDSDRLEHQNFGWPLTEVTPWPEPIAVRGLQGFWNWPYEVAQ